MFGLILLDLLSFAIVFSLGTILAVALYCALGHSISLDAPHYMVYPSFYLIFFTFIIVLMFYKDQDKEFEEKIKAMRTLAGSIAHEVRTPALVIMTTAKNIKLKESKTFDEKMQIISKEAADILGVMEMMLVKLSNKTTRLNNTFVSTRDFLTNVLEQYPFLEEERELMHIDVIGADFELYIDERLMTHVIFNLIQNAIHQIKAAKKGEIFITVKREEKKKILSVKDTATGIKKSKINDIFEPFVTHRNNGTGLGLDFCRKSVNAMSGTLKCRSEYGKYAEFIIEF
jgi:signal transduction histidine kinase